MNWPTNLFGSASHRTSEVSTDDFIKQYEAKERAANAAASVNGKHYTEYVETVKSLKREGKLGEAEKLLIRLVAATEAEALITSLGVAPWYYEQLAIICRKQGRTMDERRILERYVQQPKALGAKPEKLEARLQALIVRKPKA